MQKRYFLHSTQYRTFYASMLTGTRSRIEKVAAIISQLETDQAEAGGKAAKAQNDYRPNATEKKQQKAQNLATHWRNINEKQRELLELINSVSADTPPKTGSTEQLAEELAAFDALHGGLV